MDLGTWPRLCLFCNSFLFAHQYFTFWSPRRAAVCRGAATPGGGSAHPRGGAAAAPAQDPEASWPKSARVVR